MKPEKQRTYNAILRCVCGSFVAKEKRQECVRRCACACVCVRVALLIQHAKRMSHIILLLVASLAPINISTSSHKNTIFVKKKSY
jgi:hypothetical protein